ncbi:MAG: AraC family transcriptional regulator [Propionivibrio sp.]
MAEADFSRYLTHSAEDEKWQMVCTDAGRNVIPPGSPYPPHIDNHPASFRSVCVGRRLNEYQMVYIPAGRGTLEMDGRTYAIEAGSLFLLFPDVAHAYQPDPATGWTELWVGFSGPQVDALLSADIISPAKPVFRLGHQAKLIGGFQAIFEQVRQQSPLYQFRVCADVLRLLAETLSLERLSAQPTRSQQIVEQAKAFIEENISAAFDLEGLAARTRLSLASLNEVFKSYTGMTPYQYCIHAKINRAKEILATGETSVKAISLALGFDDPYYFSRLFKKKTGVSPSQWMSDDGTAESRIE